MGYTTEFEGVFRCRRVVQPEVSAFLESVASDVRIIQVLADWLEERGDERASRARACRSSQDIWNVFHALTKEQAAYLRQFSRTRRMKRDPGIASTYPDPIREAVGLPIGDEAGYFVGGEGSFGQAHDASVQDYNRPPRSQPGLWCQWVPNDDGSAILWNGAEKFYSYVSWIRYLIVHFLAPWGYLLDGEVVWQGEEESDQGIIRIQENKVSEISKE